ncbi:MAG: hypothetical protein WC455_15710 [Dehalococcoidia bacterium]|jgi:hypothetical protein
MYYFRFDIPTNADGTTVTYSPGWCGTRPKCAQKETGIYYNDKERWGIGIAEGSFVAPDMEVIDAAKVAELMGIKEVVDSKALITQEAGELKFDGRAVALPEITDEKVYYGQKLADRYLPQTETVDIPDTVEELLAQDAPERKAVDTFTEFCPICHQLTAYVGKYEDGSVKIVQSGKTIVDGIKAQSINLMCPNGHKVQVTLNG